MANTRKKRGRSKVGEVAAPTNEVTTSVEARGVPLTDTEPPKKKGGRSKGKVGSENEPVETAPGDGELNISEEGVTEATATTIFQEVTNSTEVGGVPPTDPPMSEVPNSDEGGVKVGELNISEEGVTEATATTILQEVSLIDLISFHVCPGYFYISTSMIVTFREQNGMLTTASYKIW